MSDKDTSEKEEEEEEGHVSGSFFFGGGDGGSSSDDSEEEEEEDARKNKRRREDAPRVTEQEPALPSVADLFSSTKTPSFLEASKGKYDMQETVTFDKRSEAEVKRMPWLRKSQTVETKQQREEKAAKQPVPTNAFVAELQQAAMMNSKSYKDEEPEGFKIKKAPIPIRDLDKKKKDPKDKQSDKGKSFAEKEKRKRDLGMQSRGKSTVEEEKRILRESVGSQGFGYD